MQVRDAIEHRFPCSHVADIQQILSDVLISSLETSLDTCGRFIRKLDRHLHIPMHTASPAYSTQQSAHLHATVNTFMLYYSVAHQRSGKSAAEYRFGAVPDVHVQCVSPQ